MTDWTEFDLVVPMARSCEAGWTFETSGSSYRVEACEPMADGRYLVGLNLIALYATSIDGGRL